MVAEIVLCSIDFEVLKLNMKMLYQSEDHFRTAL